MVINTLIEDAVNNNYLNDLLKKAETYVGYKFFKLDEKEYILTKKEYIDLLRFADIFSHSVKPEIRSISYKIVSLLSEDSNHSQVYHTYANAILSKIGNFPGLKNINQNGKEPILPLDRQVEKVYKQILQKVPYSEDTFTDAQFLIFQSLINSNHFSFSGPTSLGKSYIIQSFIKYITSMGDTRENIVVLVPTRALLNQTALDLKTQYGENSLYKIITYPKVPFFLNRNNSKYIFVFTPERLISYLSNLQNPKIGYLFVDEAHKILSQNDSRSPLYYHAIVQAERKSIKLFFASPNVPNPDIFLRLFELSTEEQLYIGESPVAQNRFFLDLIEGKSFLIHADGTQTNIKTNLESSNFNYWLKRLGSNEKNIIYCNTISDTIRYALSFANELEEKNCEELEEIINLTKDHLHKDYYLIQCLRKGIAFHFGKLPQNIRQKIEALFQSKVLDYVFCTSTLLEGVNLPAKNIFILSNAMGLSKFDDIDFWNLAGRAGRLTKELAGNVICVRAEKRKNRWETDSDLDLLRNTKIEQKKYPIDKSRKSIFDNMEHSLKNEAYSKKNPTATEINMWNHFANIALIHEKIGEESVLKSNFIEKNPNAKKLLNKVNQEIKVPFDVLISSSSIKPVYQNKILKIQNLEPLPDYVDYATAKKFLLKLSDYYNWEHEESYGHDPMIPKSTSILSYYALLMNQWMNGYPISQIILSSIRWYSQGKQIWNKWSRNWEFFQESNPIHINNVVNEVISKIEDILRFRLEYYFQNYFLLLKTKYGEETGANWAEFLEYGTTDKKIIELQNIGFPRHIARYILKHYSDNLNFKNDVLIQINIKKIKEIVGKESKNSTKKELNELLVSEY